MLQRTVFSILVCLAALPLWAGYGLKFKRFTSDQGLSQNSVLCLAQDSRGFLWLGTEEGVNRYDGYEFKAFVRQILNPNSLSNNIVHAIAEDGAQQLWVGTSNGLNRFDHDTQTFQQYFHNPNTPGGLGDNRINALLCDHDGRLWIATQQGGLNQYDPTTQTFTLYQNHPDDPSSLSGNKIKALYQDRSGRLWIGTYSGLNLYNPQTDQFRRFSTGNPTADKIRGITRDSSGTLYLATIGGLYTFDPRTESFQKPTLAMRDPVCYGIMTDSQNRIWVANQDGLYRNDGHGFQVYREEPGDLSSLGNNACMSLLEDRSGQIWVGTYTGGVSKWNPATEKMGHYRREPNRQNTLSHDSVTALVETNDDFIWIGTADGLNRWDRDKDHFTHFREEAANPHAVISSQIDSLGVGGDGTLWVGTSAGVCRKGLENDHFHPLTTNIPFTGINALAAGEGDRMWAGSLRHGLLGWRGHGRDIQHWSHDSKDPQSLSGNVVNALLLDRGGRLWIGGNGGLSWRMDDGPFHHVVDTDPRNPMRLGVTSIFEDSDGVLWIGTFGGFCRYDGNLNQFTMFNRENSSLPSDTISRILGDGSGRLWISSNKGITRFDPITGEFLNFDRAGGLQSDEFNLRSGCTTQSGALLFGGVKGFNMFFPKRLGKNTTPPKLLLTRFSKNNAPMTLNQSLDQMDQINLDYQDRLFSVDYVALDFTISEKNRYMIKMEGFDEEWVDKGASRRATYTNLDPKHYTFRVKAANSDGVWSNEDVSLNIVVTPPPWRTWWAFCLYTITIGGLLALYLRGQRKKLELAERVNERLRQVDRLKDEFLANTSHELRTPLNGIIGLTESLLEGAEGPVNPGMEETLAMVNFSARRLNNLVNDILDFSKLRNQGLALEHMAVDMHALTSVVIALVRPLLDGKQVELINDVPLDLPAVEGDEGRLQQIMFNLVGNAVKFTREGHVRVKAEQRDREIIVTVEDTGIGIPRDKHEEIFTSFEQVDGSATREFGGTGLGLTVTRRLVELHGGEIHVDSKPGEGAAFVVSLPVSDQKPTVHGGLRLSTVLADRIEEQEEHPPTTPTVEAEVDGPVFRILVVDDEPVNRRVLLNYLSFSTHQVEEASNGYEAVDMLERETFDLVLLDVMMPGMSGYRVCQMVRESHSMEDLPIIFLTAKNRVTDLVGAFESGGNDFLTKPVTREELLLRVQTHLKLLNITRHLEHLVGARTRELASANRELEAKNEKILQAQNQLVLGEKMATLGTMTAGVAHELNNPNNFIFGGVQILENELQSFRTMLLDLLSDDEVDEDMRRLVLDPFSRFEQQLSTIKTGSTRIRAVINSLRDFTRLDEAREKRADILAGLRATVELTHSQHPQVTFELDLAEPLERECRPAELSQVFLNLILNGCEAIEARRRHQPDAPGVLRISGRREGDQAVIRIQDSGEGIAEKHRDHIFEAFYTTRQPGEGTGLGLYSAWRIIKDHGGDIQVDPRPGQGALFTIRLPLDTPNPRN